MEKIKDEKIWKAAMYLRLSRDDGTNNESNSISNQRGIILDYVKNHPDINIVSECIDDGESGSNTERPDLLNMIEDVKKGVVDCIICKDLSRFSRDFLHGASYIEKVFPLLGVRLIAIGDNIDSGKNTSQDAFTVPIKLLFNDLYAHDLSVKMRSQLEIRRMKGDFTGSFSMYGYLKDENDHNKLVVDEYAAEVVRNIFQWAIEGMSQLGIAKLLNAMDVPSPLEHKKNMGMNFSEYFKLNAKAEWGARAIGRILVNEVYIGTLAQGKLTTPNHKIKKPYTKDSEEWTRVYNAHEAVISKEDFELVQNILKRISRKAPSQDAVYPFSGMLECADCGSAMVRNTIVSRGKKFIYHTCRKSKISQCTNHCVSEKELEQTVTEAIQNRILDVLEVEKALTSVRTKMNQNKTKEIDRQIAAKKTEIEQNDIVKLKLSKVLSNGTVTRSEYGELINTYDKKIDALNAEIFALTKEIERLLDPKNNSIPWIELFKKYGGFTGLNRAMVVSLIDRIIVSEDKSMEIIFRYQNEFNTAVNLILSADIKINLIGKITAASKPGEDNIAAPPVKVKRAWRTAVYARLSVENRGDKLDKSESIENQISLGEQHISRYPELRLIDVYKDNGESGVTFNRPEFVRLLEDIKTGFVDCIVCKDLSRFARNYIEAGEHMESLFPLLGIRFIAVTDNYDSETSADSITDRLLIAIKNIINTMYVKDTSHKISSALEAKRKNGEFIGSRAPFGYKKDSADKHRLIIDEETAPIVRDIYNMRLDGTSCYSIAKKLDERGVPNPTQHLINIGYLKKQPKFEHHTWDVSAVHTILRNSTYIGHISQGKSRKALWANLPELQAVPESEWVVIENTHEPIIEPDVWEKVQEINASQKEDSLKHKDKYAELGTTENILKGYVVCGICGRKMARCKRVVGGKRVVYDFLCPTHRKQADLCPQKRVRESDLIDFVFNEITTQMKLALGKDETEKMKSAEKHIEEIKTETDNIQRELNAGFRVRAKLFEEYADEIISEAEYIRAKDEYAKYEKSLEEKAIELDDLQHEEMRSNFIKKRWIATFKKYENDKSLSRGMANDLVEKVTVKDDGSLEILWKFKKVFSEDKTITNNLDGNQKNNQKICFGLG